MDTLAPTAALRQILRQEMLEGAPITTLLPSLMDACRCLGVAQAQGDRQGEGYWRLRQQAYRLGILEAVDGTPVPGRAARPAAP